MRRGARSWLWALALLAWLLAGPLRAHELQPGFLELNEEANHIYRVLWKQPLGQGRPLPMTPRFPARCEPASTATRETLAQSWVHRARIRCQGGLAGQHVEISGLEDMSTDVLVRVAHRDGRVETHLLKPAATGVRLDEAGARSAGTYFRLGVEHIALGIDHLLFVLGLLLLARGWRLLLKTITSFTVGHSLTLALVTLTRVDPPARVLEACIALSILFLAPEVVRLWRGQTSLTIRQPWLVAFAFGLLHGMAFAGGLRALGLPSDEVPTALLLFNLGVEAGQLAFVGVALGLAAVAGRLRLPAPIWLLRLPAYVLGTMGSYWAIDRTLAIFVS